MWKNYIKTSIRNIARNPAYSLINVLGLSIGICALILISLYVQFELSYDKHIPDAENIYRVTTDMRWPDGQHQETAVSLAGVPWFMMHDFPEVESSTRYYYLISSLVRKVDTEVSLESDQGFYEDNIIVADSGFFEVFRFQMSRGNGTEILKTPGKVILTQETAEKYFGDENVVGKKLLINNDELLTVGGVLEEIPGNTHIKFDFIVSGPDNPAFSIDDLQNLGNYGYVRFASEANIENFITKIPQFEVAHLGPYDDNTDVRIQPMLDIHLHNDRIYDRVVEADYQNVLIIGAIGIIILLIACINFINLTTARSAKRSKEVAIRKVTGASRNKLIGQFLIESFIIAILSLFIGLVLVETFLPEFRNITSTNLILEYKTQIHYLLALAVVVGLFSGFYPALVLSGFQPMTIIRGQSPRSRKRGSLQKVLVVFQFSITIALIITLGVILKQMHFIKKTDLGYDHEDVTYIIFPSNSRVDAPLLLKNKLLQYPGIEEVSLSDQMLGNTPSGEHFIPEGSENWSPHRYINVDCDFIPFYNMELLSGRNFSKEFPTDSVAVVLNETAAKSFGWSVSEAIGKEIKWNFSSSWDDIIIGKVIGVIKDFHVTDLHSPIESLILTMNRAFNPAVAIRLSEGFTPDVLDYIKEQQNEVMSGYPFDPIYLSKELETRYSQDYQFLDLVRYFALIAILIATLGLLGLSSFMIIRRFKELGIRKTFGASSGEILLLLTLGFEKWVILSNLIAWPIAWYFSSNWLDQFAYKTTIPWWMFLLGFLFSISLAFFTILFQVMKAARLKPVDAIRYE